MKIYRIVVDTYPTPDGLPFHNGVQALEDVDMWLQQNDVVRSRTMEADVHGNDEAVSFPGQRRNYFSRSSAVRKLKLFESFGCTAHIETSDPIVWSNHE